MHWRPLLLSTLLVFPSCAKKKGSDAVDDQVSRTESQDVAAAKVAPKAPDAPTELKGDGDAWVPQEFQVGIEKFKDPAVYVDGVPKAFLKFGDLPIPLRVAWFEEESAVAFKPGDPGPRSEIVRQRRYAFQDLFKALGIDQKRIKEVHIYGGSKRAIAVVVTGDKFRKHPEFTFRFGSDVFGKPIPSCPDDFADGNCPDNIRAIAVYMDKEPPQRQGGSFYFGKEKVEGIPYFGDPLRGGVRIYSDQVFAAQLKRNKLEEEGEAYRFTLPDGGVRYRLNGFLESQGIATDKIVEAWVIHRDRRVKRFSKAELADLYFATSDRGSGTVLVGPDRVQANAIALHSAPINPKDLPVPETFELHDERRE